MGIHGYTWGYINIHGSTLAYTGIHGYTWVYINIDGSTWVYIDIHGYSQVFTFIYNNLRLKHI